MRIINAEAVEVKLEGELVLHDLSFQLEQGEMVAVVGPSGCGKTLLGRLTAGMITHSKGVFFVAEGVKAVFVEQQDNFFAESGMRHTYYSQRYEYFEGRAVPTVATLLNIDIDNWQDDARLADIVVRLKIDYLLDRQLLLLSNGERKRVQIVSALLKNEDLYVFDQPFLGLDVKSRQILKEIMLQLKEMGKTILLISNKREIPDFCNSVIEMKKGKISSQLTYAEFAGNLVDDKPMTFDLDKLQLPLPEEFDYDEVVRMCNVCVKSAGKQILQDINWTIKNNERWLLAGHNGSGKSTLLSLITADNPQAYTNDLELFGRKRGSGETIWDIKKKIGFVSPELHLYFMRQTKLTGFKTSMQHSIDCMSVVVSGYNEEIGFSSKNTIHQNKMAEEWLEATGLSSLAKKQFAEISLGEQRMLLLIRALVKNPPLLILDEPCQGIDYEQSQKFIQLLDAICSEQNTTMIYVTHSADEVPACITHKIELEAGAVSYCGEI